VVRAVGIALIVSTAALAACVSRPAAPGLSADERARLRALDPGRFLAQVEGCRSDISEEFCWQIAEDLTRVLRLSGLFADVDDYGGDLSRANLLLGIRQVPINPSWENPARNPAGLLLLLAVPLPWRTRHGYAVSLRCAGSGEASDVDTTRDGLSIVWSLASLLNVLPGRGLREDPRRETERILLQAEDVLRSCAG
jgi:hypothetical protein